jgi:hypothetical protein
MIKKLQRIIVSNEADGTQVTKLPSNEDMMNKINEIIHVVNKLESDRQNRELGNMFKSRTTS